MLLVVTLRPCYTGAGGACGRTYYGTRARHIGSLGGGHRGRRSHRPSSPYLHPPAKQAALIGVRHAAARPQQRPRQEQRKRTRSAPNSSMCDPSSPCRAGIATPSASRSAQSHPSRLRFVEAGDSSGKRGERFVAQRPRQRRCRQRPGRGAQRRPTHPFQRSAAPRATRRAAALGSPPVPTCACKSLRWFVERQHLDNGAWRSVGIACSAGRLSRTHQLIP